MVNATNLVEKLKASSDANVCVFVLVLPFAFGFLLLVLIQIGYITVNVVSESVFPQERNLGGAIEAMITSQPELQEEIDHIFVSVDELENVVVGGEGDEGDEKDEEKKKAKRKLNLIAKKFVDLKYTTGGLLVVTVYLNFVFCFTSSFRL